MPYVDGFIVPVPKRKVEAYGRMAQKAGRVWRKHRFPLWQVVYHLARPLGGAVTGLAQGRPQKAKYHLSAFRGRLLGWLSRT